MKFKLLLVVAAAVAVVAGGFMFLKLTQTPQPASQPRSTSSSAASPAPNTAVATPTAPRLKQEDVIPAFYNPSPIATHRFLAFASAGGYTAFAVEQKMGANPPVIHVTLLKYENGKWQRLSVGKGQPCAAPPDAPSKVRRIVC